MRVPYIISHYGMEWKEPFKVPRSQIQAQLYNFLSPSETEQLRRGQKKQSVTKKKGDKTNVKKEQREARAPLSDGAPTAD